MAIINKNIVDPRMLIYMKS